MGEKIAKILKVAVTGGAGSGKTLVCNQLKKHDIKVISSDDLAREAVLPGSRAHEKIVGFFGKKVLLDNGTLNRKKLRRMIAQDDTIRLTLERFVHPEIAKLIRKKRAQLEKEGCRIVVVEIPLLFELDMQDQFDWIIVVTSGRDLRVKRLMKRDHISRDEAEKLINIQMPDEEKIERADFVLPNDGEKEPLRRIVDLLCKNHFQQNI
jgi:dephospho-CoA kinase